MVSLPEKKKKKKDKEIENRTEGSGPTFGERPRWKERRRAGIDFLVNNARKGGSF